MDTDITFDFEQTLETQQLGGPSAAGGRLVEKPRNYRQVCTVLSTQSLLLRFSVPGYPSTYFPLHVDGMYVLA